MSPAVRAEKAELATKVFNLPAAMNRQIVVSAPLGVNLSPVMSNAAR
jgi:hypothetical protein